VGAHDADGSDAMTTSISPDSPDELPKVRREMVFKHFGSDVGHPLLRTVWKDGIDLEVPTYALQCFAEAYARDALAQAAPSIEPCRSQTGQSEPQAPLSLTDAPQAPLPQPEGMGRRGPCKGDWCQSAADNGDSACEPGVCVMSGWPARPSTPEDLNPLREALQAARNGLVWYYDMCPQFNSGSDDEMLEQIDAALSGSVHPAGAPSDYLNPHG
jgi:hypothetical protein